MARGRSNSGRMAARSQNPTASANNSLSAFLSPSPAPSLSLSDIEDNRLFTFDPPSSMTIGGRVARVIVHKRPIIARANTIFSARSYPVGLQVPVGIKFESPLKVITCLRRKIRRQIMFVTNKAGKGVRKRRPRRSYRSTVSC